MKNIKFYYNKPSLIFNIDIVKKKDYEWRTGDGSAS